MKNSNLQMENDISLQQVADLIGLLRQDVYDLKGELVSVKAEVRAIKADAWSAPYDENFDSHMVRTSSFSDYANVKLKGGAGTSFFESPKKAKPLPSNHHE